MKRRLLHYRSGALLMLLLLLGTMAMAQPRRQERVHALKIAYITDKLKLSAEQAERFWPVYYRYEDELMKNRQQFMKQYRRQKGSGSEAEARRFVEDNLDYQESMITLKRKYKDEFLKLISAQQLADLYAAEREFRQLLIQKLRERRGRR